MAHPMHKIAVDHQPRGPAPQGPRSLLEDDVPVASPVHDLHSRLADLSTVAPRPFTIHPGTMRLGIFVVVPLVMWMTILQTARVII